MAAGRRIPESLVARHCEYRYCNPSSLRKPLTRLSVLTGINVTIRLCGLALVWSRMPDDSWYVVSGVLAPAGSTQGLVCLRRIILMNAAKGSQYLFEHDLMLSFITCQCQLLRDLWCRRLKRSCIVASPWMEIECSPLLMSSRRQTGDMVGPRHEGVRVRLVTLLSSKSRLPPFCSKHITLPFALHKHTHT